MSVVGNVGMAGELGAEGAHPEVQPPAEPQNSSELQSPAAPHSVEPAHSAASLEPLGSSHGESARQPSFLFFGIVASISLALDVASKAWAALKLENSLDPIVLVDNHLNFIWALNRGGAWGILQDAGEAVRKPFFFVVSLFAVVFIVALYGRLHPSQKALKWGLPLVLGGALGNLADRIVRGSVIDFIDYRADWVATMNGWVKSLVESWSVTDHWPTFNVADISICAGVILMAVDMFTSKRRHDELSRAEASRAESSNGAHSQAAGPEPLASSSPQAPSPSQAPEAN